MNKKKGERDLKTISSKDPAEGEEITPEVKKIFNAHKKKTFNVVY